ncbi:heparinase II/III family protein [uncultured Serinicoccus sp.]|uniref:heparinase II/III domain-containing protein n=1 Tax=uncultured Serinicoccus sp. TaxID=735514 RepID=UPI00260AAB23|nr:heparinase II/III family protein [uncultured Serinicoccus sp.]
MKFSRQMAAELAFGGPWSKTTQDSKKARRLLSGELELFPNPVWKMSEELTWREDPFNEPNWVVQYHSLRWLDPLRRRAELGDDTHLDFWLQVTESWISANPPGRGRSPRAWADMVEAGRALTLCFALPAIEDLRPERLPLILSSLQEHGRWLADPKHIRRGNHGLQQHQGLLVIGAVLERDDWTTLALERLSQKLRESYDEEGIYEEGSTQYHQINYVWWQALRKRIQIIGRESDLQFDRLSLAPVALAHATRPDGRYELIGDTEEFPSRTLGHPHIDFVSTGGEQGSPPPDQVKIYKSGYVFGRSSWGDEAVPFGDSSFYSLRFGPQKRIHGHADGMSLTLYADRAPLLVDSGKFAYDTNDPHRRHLLTREAHNSLSVEGRPYDLSHAVTLTASGIGEGVEYYQFMDCGYEGVMLTRRLLISLARRLIVVLDSFESDAEVRVNQSWHLNPVASHRKEGDSIFVRTRGNSMRMAWVAGQSERRVTQGATQPMQGWFSPSWRKIIPARTIEAFGVGRQGDLAMALNFRESESPLVMVPVPHDTTATTFHIWRGEETYVASFAEGGGRLSILGGETSPTSLHDG